MSISGLSAGLMVVLLVVFRLVALLVHREDEYGGVRGRRGEKGDAGMARLELRKGRVG